jgi:salicylate hydroxylase
MRRPRILIAGGGIGGLTSALALRRVGAEVRVFEKSPSPEQSGAGLQLSPNAVRILRALGLQGVLPAVSVALECLEAVDWRSGKSIFAVPVGEMSGYTAPYLAIRRSDLRAALWQAVDGDRTVTLNARCTGVCQSKTEVTLHLEGGQSASGDILLGADGLHSVVRESLFGRQTGRIRFSAWRGTAVSPDNVDRRARVWWGPEKHFVHYPVADGTLVNWVGIVPAKAQDSDTHRAMHLREDALAVFEHWNACVLDLIRATQLVVKQPLHEYGLFRQWTKGRVTLLGDAAHPMLPFLAQGACQSIEDAYVLAETLTRQRSLLHALRSYELQRKYRNYLIQLLSDWAGRFFHVHRRSLVALRNVLAAKAAKAVHGYLFRDRSPAQRRIAAH